MGRLDEADLLYQRAEAIFPGLPAVAEVLHLGHVAVALADRPEARPGEEQDAGDDGG